MQLTRAISYQHKQHALQTTTVRLGVVKYTTVTSSMHVGVQNTNVYRALRQYARQRSFANNTLRLNMQLLALDEHLRRNSEKTPVAKK